MWQRLFHKDWRTYLEKNIGYVAAGRPASTSARVFYGKYKISVTINGKVVATRYAPIKKSQGKLNLRIPVLETVVG